MRKKSHIALAKYLVKHVKYPELSQYKNVFYLGNLLPDCKPSFLTEKHEIVQTFPKVQAEIIDLCNLQPKTKKELRQYYCRLGQVIHYVADYFTFPHNRNFPGGLKAHCKYEETLKQKLHSEIKKQPLKEGFDNAKQFLKGQEIVNYIKNKHQKYQIKQSYVQRDIQYIWEVSYQVLCGILECKTRKE